MATRQVEAKLILSAVDRTGKAFKSVSGRLSGVNRRAEQFNRSGRSTAQTAAAVGRAAAAVGIAVGAVGVASFRKFAGDERTLTRIGITAEATREQMADIRDELFNTAKATGLQFEDMVKGLDALTASGRTLEEAMALLPSVAVTAQASGAEMADIATSADALFTSMNIRVEDMQGAFDILVAGGKAGKFELKDMAQFLPSLAPAFKALGYEGEEGLKKLVVALQTVRTQTGSSGEAATAFMDILTKMEGQTVNNNFKKFGVDLRGSLAKARKEGEDILQAFMRISKEAVKGDLSKLPQLFTDKQMLIGMRSLITSADAMEKFNAALKDVDGSALNDLGTIMQDQQANIDKMATSWNRFMGNIGAGIAPSIGGALDEINEKIEFTEALKKGLEDEDLNYLHKKTLLAYPNRNDPFIIEQAKQGGYKFETFEGGKRETKTEKIDGSDVPIPVNIPVPSHAPMAGAENFSNANIPMPRTDALARVKAEQNPLLGSDIIGGYGNQGKKPDDVALLPTKVLSPVSKKYSAASVPVSRVDDAARLNPLLGPDIIGGYDNHGKKRDNVAPNTAKMPISNNDSGVVTDLSTYGFQSKPLGNVLSNFDGNGKFNPPGNDVKLSTELETTKADQALDQFNDKAEQPVTATLQLDTSAAEAKLSSFESRVANLQNNMSNFGVNSNRNKGQSMPSAR